MQRPDLAEILALLDRGQALVKQARIHCSQPRQRLDLPRRLLLGLTLLHYGETS
jgi:hypothetical protein